MLATLLGLGILIAILRFTDIHIDVPTCIGAFSSFSLSYILYRISKYRPVYSLVKDVPGRTVWLTPFSSLPSLALPSIPYISWGGYFGYLDIASARAKTYEKWNTTIYRIMGVSQPHATFRIADPVSIKYILDLENRALFPKWLDIYKIIRIFGTSLIISEGETFRRHRKIVAKAFTADVNELVWKASNDVSRVWVKELAAKADSEGVAMEEGVVKRCFDLALYVICTTAYGVQVPILSEQFNPSSFTSQFKDAIYGTCSNLMTLVVSLNYMGKLPFAKVHEAYDYKNNLDRAMKELVAERRKAIADGSGEDKKDLLSCLIRANDAEESGMDKDAETGRRVEKLSEEELLGNIWLFLLAGHETSSHTLSYTLALMAIYPEEQEKLYSHIMEVCPEASDPSHTIPYSLYPHFTRALACVYESLRRYPAVVDIPKMVRDDQDVMLPTSERGPLKGEKVFLPRDSKIFLDVWGMQHDPAVWKDPYTFNPDRFIDTETYTWPRDLLFSFSGGARSCTGQNFARTELVCLLISIVRSYKITLPPAVAAMNKSKLEIERIMLKNTLLVSLSPDEFKLCFEARK